jgi:hypothetical protein
MDTSGSGIAGGTRKDDVPILKVGAEAVNRGFARSKEVITTSGSEEG